tara:strand:+ start:99 stop:629 length:531 start_codon:yes stop_codon:yes gene_type:complete
MYWGLSVTSLDEVKRLLDGKVDPEGLEINSELYEMAESIYGREALEQMGIDAPARPTDSIVQPNGNAKHEVQMPVESNPEPEISPPKPKKRSWWIFIPSLIITITIIVNFVRGIGGILPLCDPPNSGTVCEDKLILTSITEYQSPDSWSQTMQLEFVEAGILSFLLIVMLFSIRKR